MNYMLEEIINTSKEGELQKYLTDNKKILVAAFGEPGWFYNIVIPKFRFGSDFESDFIVLTGQSYNYWIKLVELEPSLTSPFTKEGIYSKRLNQAIKQVDEWKDWIVRHETYFKESLLKAIKIHNPSFDETFDFARKFYVSPHIVIGRRGSLTPDDNRRRANELEKSHLDIMTYDRLIDIERKIINLENKGIPFDRYRFEI
ncbi:hypothetical protein D3C75_622830 [compost metagenome]